MFINLEIIFWALFTNLKLLYHYNWTQTYKENTKVSRDAACTNFILEYPKAPDPMNCHYGEPAIYALACTNFILKQPKAPDPNDSSYGEPARYALPCTNFPLDQPKAPDPVYGIENGTNNP